MLSVCICDDEPTLCQDLKEKLQRYRSAEEINIIEYHDTSELLESSFYFDVVFLDIRFNGEDLGIETARRMRQKNIDSIIIFLSNMEQYALSGYEVDAFRYLLKPIKYEKLVEVMDAALDKIDAKKKKISVVSNSENVLIKISEIEYIESTARRRYIYTAKDKISTWETMTDLFSRLPEHKFAYLQKGFVCNLSIIDRVKNNMVTLKNGKQVPLSRNYKHDFLIAFNRYVGGGK